MSTIRIFRHYVKLPILVLGILESVVFALAVYGSSYTRFSGDTWLVKEHLGSVFPHALMFSSLMVTGMLATGLYRSGTTHSVVDFLLRFVVAIVFVFAILALLFYLFPGLLVGRGVLALATALSFLGVASLRGAFFHLVDQDALKRRILVLGAGKNAQSILELEKQTPEAGFQIIGYAKTPGDDPVCALHRAIEMKSGLIEFVIHHDIEEIVVALDERRNHFPLDELLQCKSQGVEVIDQLTFFERETGRVPLELLYPSWLVFSDGWKVGTLQKTSRRIFDVVVSLLILMVAWPAMLLTAVAILIEDGFGSPIFYRQTRVGYNGAPFDVLKFRSMVVDAESDGRARWAQENDIRVTRVGGFIRKTRVDELPQIFNVIRGQMSFVGPRPERPEFVSELSKTIPFYAERHRVKPGITGWAQLRYRYGASEEDAAEKLQYDLYYVKNHSLFLDALILLQTAEVIIWCRGSR